MDYTHYVLNNVALCETFMSMFQIRIDQLPDVLLIDFNDLNRYVLEYIDDSISQYSDWCATTNKASDIEFEFRSKLKFIGHAFNVDLTPVIDNWFEALDKWVLSIIDENIRLMHVSTSRDNVFKATVLNDSTVIIENLGAANG